MSSFPAERQRYFKPTRHPQANIYFFYHLALLSRMTLQKKENTYQLQPLQSLEDVDLTHLPLASGSTHNSYTLSREVQHHAGGALLRHLTGHRSLLPQMLRTKLWRMNRGAKALRGMAGTQLSPPQAGRAASAECSALHLAEAHVRVPRAV